jgi:ribosome-binding factor A
MAPRSSDRSYGGAAGFPRSRRVNQLVREVVADELERLADADDRLRFLTVTEVDTAADLRHATVYLSSLPDGALEALDERRVALQAAVGRQARMKRTPRLSFEADPAIAHGAAIEDALRRLSTDED